MPIRNKEEILQRYTEILGSDFARVLYAVLSEWTAAWVRHNELFTLFGDRENIEILNMVEPRFFGDVQRLFYNDLILHIARLTDPSKRSLSVHSLERYVKDDPDLLERLRNNRKAAITAAEPVRDLRNRSLVHRDKALVMSGSDDLMPVTPKVCKQVLDCVYDTLKTIEMHFMESHLTNEVHHSAAGSSLVDLLGRLVSSVRFIASIVDPDNPDNPDYEKGELFVSGLSIAKEDAGERIYELLSTVLWLSRRKVREGD